MQDHLQRALAIFTDAPVEVTAAGRTDTGVHATAQVVHFDTAARREEVSWVRGTNSNLHEGARVLWAREVAAEFKYEGRIEAWQKLTRHEVDPVKALLEGTFQIKGNLAKAMRFTRAAKELVETAATIPTEW